MTLSTISVISRRREMISMHTKEKRWQSIMKNCVSRGNGRIRNVGTLSHAGNDRIKIGILYGKYQCHYEKLQRAILQTGLVVKIGTSQFYSDEQDRIITMYILSTPTLQQKKDGTWKMRDYEILRSASMIDVVECLNEIYKAVGK